MYIKKDYIAYKERQSYVHRDGRRVEWYFRNLGLFGSSTPLLSEAIQAELTLSSNGVIGGPKADPSSFTSFRYIIHYSMNRVFHGAYSKISSLLLLFTITHVEILKSLCESSICVASEYRVSPEKG